LERKKGLGLMLTLFLLAISLIVSGIIAYSYVTHSFSAGLCVWTAADANDDGIVDIYDLFDLGKSYDSVLGDTSYDPDCDFNGDDKVDKSDLLHLSKDYGKIKPC